MTTSKPSIPETKVLAIASHVAYGYVGNTMATFVMQALGCEVSAINTVNFSNHTGYRQRTGTKTPASDIQDLYDGLKQSYLTDFNVLLSGYSPSADVVETIGKIARDLRYRSTTRPGSFFWILDPVMGDQGKLYVAPEIVPAYKEVLREADLILPNQFEAEQLSGVSIESMSGVANAISTIHKAYGVKHVVVTSVSFGKKDQGQQQSQDQTTGSGDEESELAVVGSSMRTDGSVRCFKVVVAKLDCFFSGTGDMFAGLMVARLREASHEAGLLTTRSWMPPDDVPAVELPLAKAIAKILDSMHIILRKTLVARDEEMRRWEGIGDDEVGVGGSTTVKRRASAALGVGGVDGEGESNGEAKRRHLAQVKAAEVRVVRNQADLVNPPQKYKVEPVDAVGGAQ